jgi:acetoin utilization protein AcuB
MSPIEAITGPSPITDQGKSGPGYQREEKPRRTVVVPIAEEQESGSLLKAASLAVRRAYQKAASEVDGKKPALVAQDLMTAPVEVVHRDLNIREAWRLMKTKGFRHVPVVAESGELVGILSDRDLLKYVTEWERVGEGHGAASDQQITVGDVMLTKVLTGSPTVPIREMARVMLQEQVGALPIVDAAFRPVGILTVTDILKALVNRAPLELWS